MCQSSNPHSLLHVEGTTDAGGESNRSNLESFSARLVAGAALRCLLKIGSCLCHQVVFATETLAAGVNMPARATVITTLSKRIDTGIVKLNPSQLLQMGGR